jgi:hypothetical protein
VLRCTPDPRQLQQQLQQQENDTMSHDEHYAAGMELRRSMWGEAGAEPRVNQATSFNRPLEDMVTTYSVISGSDRVSIARPAA